MTANECFLACVNALNTLPIPYMVVGSFSSNVYGLPRSTKDADFVIQCDEKTITRIATSLGSEFKLDPQMTFETITGTYRYKFYPPHSQFVIEFFVLSNDPHDQERFSRKVRAEVTGVQAFVPTAEDVIITKLRWSKSGLREKDIADVRGVISVQNQSLDIAYIRSWTDKQGTTELLNKLLPAI